MAQRIKSTDYKEQSLRMANLMMMPLVYMLNEFVWPVSRGLLKGSIKSSLLTYEGITSLFHKTKEAMRELKDEATVEFNNQHPIDTTTALETNPRGNRSENQFKRAKNYNRPTKPRRSHTPEKVQSTTRKRNQSTTTRKVQSRANVKGRSSAMKIKKKR